MARLTADKQRLIDTWLEKYTPIAVAVSAAKKSVMHLRRSGMTDDEIVSLVHLALVGAAIDYDAEKGAQFATYAWSRIEGNLQTAARSIKPALASIDERMETLGEPVIDKSGDRYREMAEWEMESDAGVSLIDKLVDTAGQDTKTRERLIRGRNLFISVHLHEMTLAEAAKQLGYNADQSRADYALVKSEIARRRNRR